MVKVMAKLILIELNGHNKLYLKKERTIVAALQDVSDAFLLCSALEDNFQDPLFFFTYVSLHALLAYI